MKGNTALTGLRTRDRKLRESRLPLTAEFIAGVWLVIAAFAYSYSYTLSAVAGFWNSLLCGIVVAAVALVRFGLPERARWLGVVNLAIGAWLIVAPFAFGYPVDGHRDALRTSALLVGVLLAIFSVVSMTVAFRRHSGDFRE
ncbi:SPW repeat domain-containing protein [Amycolatopsis benzoatilytica]|uniref:SPW repeat domain-containing protein n=1 Tax=Amycolatopsis benzoatilytica TaxID=346045 RepID=UPI00035E753F|nr:SPW repeat protein [Amycolatopsis benzoatilytica]